MASRYFERQGKKNRLIMSLILWNRRRVDRYNARKRAAFSQAHKLGVLGIMKNEEMAVIEWIEHYLWCGAGAIFLIDNGSTDSSVEHIRPYVDRGVVRLIQCPQPWKQVEHYWTAVQELDIRIECQWLLIADLDEFWFCPSGQKLTSALTSFDAFDVIQANWTNFGSSGLKAQPTSIREGFVHRREIMPSYSWSKYICKTSVIRKKANLEIHRFTGARSEKTVTSNDIFQINHYPIQSEEFFRKVKMTRGDANNPVHDSTRDMRYFAEHDASCTTHDDALARLVAEKPVLD